MESVERMIASSQSMCTRTLPGLGNHEVIMSVKRKATLIHNKANGFGELFDHIMELL